MHQLEPDIRHAVLGNAATVISFRVGPEDAGILAREFQPKSEVGDLINLPNRDIYLKLMIDGTPSPPFSARAANMAAVETTKIGAAEIAIGSKKVDRAPIFGFLWLNWKR